MSESNCPAPAENPFAIVLADRRRPRRRATSSGPAWSRCRRGAWARRRARAGGRPRPRRPRRPGGPPYGSAIGSWGIASPSIQSSPSGDRDRAGRSRRRPPRSTPHHLSARCAGVHDADACASARWRPRRSSSPRRRRRVTPEQVLDPCRSLGRPDTGTGARHGRERERGGRASSSRRTGSRPGSITIRLAGVATGVRNAAAAATRPPSAPARPRRPSSAAAETAIGITISAVAMLVMSWPSARTSTNRPSSSP